MRSSPRITILIWRTLQNSMRGVKSDREADGLIASAKRTRAYLSFLVKQSGG